MDDLLSTQTAKLHCVDKFHVTQYWAGVGGASNHRTCRHGINGVCSEGGISLASGNGMKSSQSTCSAQVRELVWLPWQSLPLGRYLGPSQLGPSQSTLTLSWDQTMWSIGGRYSTTRVISTFQASLAI